MTCARDAFWEAAGRGWWVEPVSAVEYRCAPEWHVLPRTIGDYMLWYVRGGVGILAMADQEYPLRAGDVLFVAPGVTHSAAHDPARPLWTITTHFTFRNTEGEALTPPSDALPPVRRSTGEPHVFDAYFARLLTLEALRPSGWQAIARAVLLAVLTELRRENVQATITPAMGHGEYSAIAEALLRLEAEGTYFTAPGTLARACGFSPGYFSRLFRRQFGRTPQQYLITRRMERARHLLLESDLSVEQVARSLGYHDVFFFTDRAPLGVEAHVLKPWEETASAGGFSPKIRFDTPTPFVVPRNATCRRPREPTRGSEWGTA